MPDKATRVHQFHKNTIHALAEMVAAMGLDHPSQLNPSLMVKRVNQSIVQTFAEIYPHYELNCLIDGTGPGALPAPVGPRRRRHVLAAHPQLIR